MALARAHRRAVGGRHAPASTRASRELDPPPGDPGPDELFSGTVYIRGGMTLQALREQVGDDDFFEILRTWIDEHRDGTASTEDFIALAEEVSGDELDDAVPAPGSTPPSCPTSEPDRQAVGQPGGARAPRRR